MSDSNEPWRSRSSRASSETQSWRHETPIPGTWVGGGVPSCKFVCFICTRFERQERFQIWVFRSLGEKEMEDEKKKVKGRRTYRLGFAIVVCILTDDWVCVCCSCVWLTRKISCWVCVCVSGKVIFGF